jgi:hypothetical protein
MRKKILFTVICAVCVIMIAASYRLGYALGADDGTAGSASDPLVTKSYLDKRLSDAGLSGGTYENVTVSKGKTLYADSGDTMIMASGSGIVVGNGGLINTTTGELFKKNNSAVRYNMYISPGDGCGIRAQSEMVIYICGSYEIK